MSTAERRSRDTDVRLVGNQTRLVKKEDLLVRLGRSTDRWDSLIQSFAFA